MERALQLQNPDTVIPYWDTTLDRHIPDPRESVLFSEHLFGNIFGEVNKLLINNCENRTIFLWNAGAVFSLSYSGNTDFFLVLCKTGNNWSLRLVQSFGELCGIFRLHTFIPRYWLWWWGWCQVNNPHIMIFALKMTQITKWKYLAHV